MTSLTVSLPAAITVETVGLLREELVAALQAQEGGDLSLDARATESITSPGAQLLIALHKTLDQKGRTLRLIHVNESLKRHFDLLGLTELQTEWEKPE